MDPVVVASALTRSYGERFTLEVERLALRPGEIVAVMGPSGSGKTTLLRLLATLETPTSGDVRFGDLVWNGGSLNPSQLLAWRRGLAFVPQNPVLFSGRVLENVTLGLSFRGLSGSAADAAATSVLDGLGLAPLTRVRADSLSAGEAQRVALARALVTRPEVLLLDEPTANLDPANVALIETTLSEAVSAWRPAALVVTHNLFQARRLAHRVGFLIAGRLIEFGETARVFERPADPRTAAFVRGEMVC